MHDVVVLTQPYPRREVRVDIHNRLAVSSGITAGALGLVAFLVVSALGAAALAPLATFAGGAYASYLYGRRSGAPVTLGSGAKLGWISGVVTFLVIALLSAMCVALFEANREMMDAYIKAAQSSGTQAQDLGRMKEILENPSQLLVSAPVLFFMLSALSTLGGMLHAFTMRRRGEPR